VNGDGEESDARGYGGRTWRTRSQRASRIRYSCSSGTRAGWAYWEEVALARGSECGDADTEQKMAQSNLRLVVVSIA
jgi:DNA-directed RNA polymerase sigma subunit (sigma70/sigma32)